MDSESKELAWVTNLREQFITFCSEADAIIPQEPIEYVRNQFLTVGESLKQFYSELVEDALPTFNVDGCMVERGPTSPRKEEITSLPSSSSWLPTEPLGNIYEDFPSKERVNMVVVENLEMETSESSKASILATFPLLDGDGNNVGLTIEEVNCDAHVNSSTSYAEETEEIVNFPDAHFAPKAEECKLLDNEVTSSASGCSIEAIHSCGLSDCIHAGEAPDSYVAELGGESTQPSEWWKLDESLTTVDSADEFCSDSDTKADRVSYQKIESPLLDKKFTKYCLCKIASEGSDDAETEAKEWEKLDEDVFDSDWEIV